MNINIVSVSCYKISYTSFSGPTCFDQLKSLSMMMPWYFMVFVCDKLGQGQVLCLCMTSGGFNVKMRWLIITSLSAFSTYVILWHKRYSILWAAMHYQWRVVSLGYGATVWQEFSAQAIDVHKGKEQWKNWVKRKQRDWRSLTWFPILRHWVGLVTLHSHSNMFQFE